MTGLRTNSAQNLKRQWNIPAVQVRYHKDGTFFMPLDTDPGQFPAALIGPDGYILFETPESYLSCKHVSIGVRLHVHPGVASIPGYVYMRNPKKAVADSLGHQRKNAFFAIDVLDAKNPGRRETVVRRHIRDTATARALKQLHGDRCQICELALPIGDETYSEAHHIQPLGDPHNGPDIPSNILVLCPNHHAQCDFGAIELSLDSLHTLPDHVPDDKYIAYHNNKIVKTKPA